MGAAGRTCTRLLNKGVPNIILADGPAGLNVLPESAVQKSGLPGYPNGLPDDWRWGWLKRVEGPLKKLMGSVVWKEHLSTKVLFTKSTFTTFTKKSPIWKICYAPQTA